MKLKYYPEYNAVICVKCRRAVPFEKLEQHGSSKHGTQTPRQRASMINRLPEDARIRRHSNIRYPILRVPAVAELHAPVEAFECQYCWQVDVSRHRLEELCAKGYCSRDLSQPRDCVKRCLAQYFCGEHPFRRYFAVRRVEDAASLQDSVDECREKDSRIQAQGPISWSFSGWQDYTGWDSFCVENEITMRQLYESALAVEDEREGVELQRTFSTARKEMAEIFEATYRLDELPRQIVQTYDDETDGIADARPMARPKCASTVAGYTLLWARFIAFCMRVWQLGHLSNLAGTPVAFTNEQGKLLDAFWDGQPVFLRLSLSFIGQQVMCNDWVRVSPVLAFVMAASVARCQAWPDAGRRVTGTVGGLLQCMQAIICSACESECSPEADYPQYLAILRREAQSWLTAWDYSVASRLLDVWVTAIISAKNDERMRRVSWNKSYSRLTYGAHRLPMGDLRRFLLDLVGEAEDLLRGKLLLFDRAKTLAEILPGSQIAGLVDERDNAEPSYNFVSEPRNGLDRFFAANVNAIDCTADLPLNDAHQAFNPQAAGEYLKAHGEFLKRIMLLFALLGGYPPRGSDLVSIGWRNTDELRQVYAVNGQIAYVCKMARQRKLVARFLPERLSRLVVLYLAAVEPFSRGLLEKRGGCVPEQRYGLFHDESGAAFDAGVPDEAIRAATARLLGESLTLAEWRVIARAILQDKLSRNNPLVARVYCEVNSVYLVDLDDNEEEDDHEDVPAADYDAESTLMGRPAGVEFAWEWERWIEISAVSTLWHQLLAG